LSTGAINGVIGINPRGEVVGCYTGADTRHAFHVYKGQYTSFDVPGAVFTCFLGINAQGDIVGYYQDTNARQHGFLLKRGV